MFTKEMMDTFTDLDLAVYDCIVKNRGPDQQDADQGAGCHGPCLHGYDPALLPEMRGGRIQ